MVETNVDLPTPFRPSTISVSPLPMLNETSSRTCVGPQPADSRSQTRTGAVAGSSMIPMPQIDIAHLRVTGNLIGRSAQPPLGLHQVRYDLGETKHELHVVFDDQNSDRRRERLDEVEHVMGVRGRYTCRRLVETEDRRVQGQTDRDLDEALPPVRKIGNRPAGVIRQIHLLQQIIGGVGGLDLCCFSEQYRSAK